MTTKRSRKGLTVLMVVALATAMLLVSGCQEEEQEKFVLRFNHVLAPTEPYHQGFLDWAKRVSERTNGGLTIEVSPSAQLGKEEDIIEQLRMGANIGQNTDSARLGMYVPAIAVLNAPYFVDNIDEVTKLRDLPAVQQWLKELEFKFGIKVLSFNWVQGHRYMITNVPIRHPDDLKGLRIRTPGVPIWQESIRAIGATPVSLPFGEVYTAMQTEAIDGAELVYRNVTGAKLFEIADYLSETGHILLINFSIVGRAWFDSLPAEYQKILIEENEKAGLETSRKMEADIAVARAELVQNGMTIITDVDVAAFRAAGEAAYAALNLTAARDKIYEQLGKTRP
ncbi:MAG: trap dicarboxylate transporter dctp subunit [Bacillota bacterium]|nr:MAG: trap dicarboxylate transporter dctp subunit [Bacillota bacterium]MBS3950634.1 C4-dicarboxylate TRAP transporter substrate-binding protein [Peptococcaceae bacterium]